MVFSIRLLTQADFDIYDAFLGPLTITSMFLRSNARKVGLDWQDKRYHGHYFGAFRDGQLCGVLALNQNGNIFTQAPDEDVMHALYDFAIQQHPGFSVKGLLGPDAQCKKILQRLNPAADNINMSETECGFRLPFTNIILPPELKTGMWRVRVIEPRDVAQTASWMQEYDVEALGAAPDKLDPISEVIENEMARAANHTGFVLEVDDNVVARSAFNAMLPETVQIGGVYTPPPLRGRGYGRAVVAGSLLLAQQNGVRESVLFANKSNAIRAYEGIGYKYETDYHLTLFKSGILLGGTLRLH